MSLGLFPTGLYKDCPKFNLHLPLSYFALLQGGHICIPRWNRENSHLPLYDQLARCSSFFECLNRGTHPSRTPWYVGNRVISRTHGHVSIVCGVRVIIKGIHLHSCSKRMMYIDAYIMNFAFLTGVLPRLRSLQIRVLCCPEYEQLPGSNETRFLHHTRGTGADSNGYTCLCQRNFQVCYRTTMIPVRKKLPVLCTPRRLHSHIYSCE